MILKIIFGQRKESYPGEYGLEAFDAATEYDCDENSTFLEERLQALNAQYGKDFDLIKIVDVKVDEKQLNKIFRPNLSVRGDVINDEQTFPHIRIFKLDEEGRYRLEDRPSLHKPMRFVQFKISKLGEVTWCEGEHLCSWPLFRYAIEDFSRIVVLSPLGKRMVAEALPF